MILMMILVGRCVNGDNEIDLNFLNEIGDDPIYISCYANQAFKTKLEVLFDSWK